MRGADLYNTGIQDLPICSMELHTLSWLKLGGQLQLAGLHDGLLQSHHVLRILSCVCTTFCELTGLGPGCVTYGVIVADLLIVCPKPSLSCKSAEAYGVTHPRG